MKTYREAIDILAHETHVTMDIRYYTWAAIKVVAQLYDVAEAQVSADCNQAIETLKKAERAIARQARIDIMNENITRKRNSENKETN